MSAFKAFIFDMNGTMIDDMHYHEQAWYDVLVNQLKAPLSLEDVRHQIYGTSAEMFQRVFGSDKFSQKEADEISSRKELKYREDFLPQLKLIEGLDQYLIELLKRQKSMAIGTAAPQENIDFVIDNLNLSKFFPVIIGPHHVKRSKPDPEVFLKAASQLNIDPKDCVVFEDAPKGIEAARRAGMKAVGITSYHTERELENSNLLFCIENYLDYRLEELV